MSGSRGRCSQLPGRCGENRVLCFVKTGVIDGQWIQVAGYSHLRDDIGSDRCLEQMVKKADLLPGMFMLRCFSLLERMGVYISDVVDDVSVCKARDPAHVHREQEQEKPLQQFQLPPLHVTANISFLFLPGDLFRFF